MIYVCSYAKFFKNFFILAILSFSERLYRINENDGVVKPTLTLSNPISTDFTLQVLNVDLTTGE